MVMNAIGRMKEAMDRNNFDAYYQKNLEFHGVFLDLCGNKNLEKIANTLKKRLYDFPRREGFVKEWELESIKEHERMARLIEERKCADAADFMRDVHWSFAVQEKFIRKYYFHTRPLNGESEP